MTLQNAHMTLQTNSVLNNSVLNDLDYVYLPFYCPHMLYV